MLGLAATLLFTNSCSSASSTSEEAETFVIRQFSGGKVIGEWLLEYGDFYVTTQGVLHTFLSGRQKSGLQSIAGDFQILVTNVTNHIEME